MPSRTASAEKKIKAPRKPKAPLTTRENLSALILYRLKSQAAVIRLDVSEAKDAFKLFETINNRGLKLSPTDIIKNFLLGNAARFGADPLQEARNSWASLIVHLDGTNPDAFFRYNLMALIGTRITASEVVAKFKNVFMSQVVEAAALPERHLYADPIEPDDAQAAAISRCARRAQLVADSHRPAPRAGVAN